MIRKKFKILSSLCFLLLGCYFINNNAIEVVEATEINNVDEYYSSLYDNNGNLMYKGEELLYKLNAIISNGHINKGYNDLAGIYKTADVDPADSNRVILYYTGESRKYDFSSYSGSINREHVWCQSHFGYSDNVQTSPYSDAHQVRPCDASLNSVRNNSYYDELTNITPDSYGNMTKGGIFYPQEAYRGDTARILFYVATRYTDLSFVDNASTGDTGSNMQMGNISALLKWNLLYDVSDTELRRNDAVEKIQGNRNPFIDHPEYASYIWGDFNTNTENIVDTYTYNISFNTSDGSVINNQEVLRNARAVKPSNPTKDGYKFVGWYEDSSLTKVYNFDTKVIENKTLYAKWVKNNEEIPNIYTINFNSNGGSEVTSLSVEEGYKVDIPLNPTKISHKFSSWTLNNAVFNFDTPITSDINLVATWDVLERETTLVSTSNYELVTDASKLRLGDKIVIGSASKEVTSGELGNSIISPLEAEFSSDGSKITMIDENYVEYMLGGRSGAWTLSYNGKLLGCTAANKLAYNSGITTWTISIDNNSASIYCTNTDYGRIMYNSTSPRFTTYTSNPNSSRVLPNIYRFVPSIEDLGPGGDNEFRNQSIISNLGFSYSLEEKQIEGAYLTKDIYMDFSSQGYTNGEAVTELKTDEVVATFDVGSNYYNSPKYYNDGKAIRVYAKNKLIVTSESLITSISITFGSGDGTNNINVDVGEFLNNVWTGSSNSVTFTVDGSTGQRRIRAINVSVQTNSQGTITEENWTFDNFYMNFMTVVSKEVFEAQDENATYGMLIKVSNNIEYNFNSILTSEFDEIYNENNGYINFEINRSDIKYEDGNYILSTRLDDILEENFEVNITSVFYVKNSESVVFSSVNVKSVQTMVDVYINEASSLNLTNLEIKALEALKNKYYW